MTIQANWRVWAYQRVINSTGVLALLPASSIFGSGSMTGAPANKPFVVLTFGPETSEFNDGGRSAATGQIMSAYVHDEPGDYQQIGAILLAIRDTLVGPVADVINGTFCQWQGDSSDLADDKFGTIMRNGEFKLTGKAA